MSKFLVTASVVSAFLIGLASPSSAVEIENNDDNEYTINVYYTGPDTVENKQFKLMPRATLKGLPCTDACSVHIEGTKGFWSHEAVVAHSKVKVRGGKIVRN